MAFSFFGGAIYGVYSAIYHYFYPAQQTEEKAPEGPLSSEIISSPPPVNAGDSSALSPQPPLPASAASASTSQTHPVTQIREEARNDAPPAVEVTNRIAERDPDPHGIRHELLTNAVIRGNFNTFRGIVEKKPFDCTSEGTKDALCALLRYAAEHGRIDILRECRQAIWEKSHRECLEKSSLIKAAPADVNEIDASTRQVFYTRWGKLVNGRDLEGNTPLLIALKNKSLDFALQLLAWGADLFLQNSAGESAIGLSDNRVNDPELRAVMGAIVGYEHDYFDGCSSEKASDFVARLAEPVGQQQRVMYVLACYVARNDSIRVKDLFCSDNEIRLIADALGKTPYSLLHYAADSYKTDALSAMMEKLPFDVCDSRTDNGRNVLMLAAKNGHVDIIFTYHRMARDKFINRYLDTDIMYFSSAEAEIKSRSGCVDPPTQSFREQWRNVVNATDHDGNTPLLLAIKNHHPECARLLLANQARVFQTNHAGESAVSIACDLPVGSTMRGILFEAMPPVYRACAQAPCYVVAPGTLKKRWLWSRFWEKNRDKKDQCAPLIRGVDMNAAMSVEVAILTRAISVVEQRSARQEKAPQAISAEQSARAFEFVTALPEMARNLIRPPKTITQLREILLLCEAMMGFKQSFSRSDLGDDQHNEALMKFRRTLFQEVDYENFKKTVMDCRETMGVWA